MHIRKIFIPLFIGIIFLLAELMILNTHSQPKWFKPNSEIEIYEQRDEKIVYVKDKKTEDKSDQLYVKLVFHDLEEGKMVTTLTVKSEKKKIDASKTIVVSFNDIKKMLCEDFDIPLYFSGLKKGSKTWITLWLPELPYIRLFVASEKKYEGRNVWVLKLDSYNIFKKKQMENMKDYEEYVIMKSDGRTVIYETGEYYKGKKIFIIYYYTLKFDNLEILVDKNTGLVLYCKIIASYKEYCCWGKKTSDLPLDIKIDKYVYQVKLNLKSKKKYGYIAFQVEDDFDYKNKMFKVSPLSQSIKILHISSKTEKVLKPDKYGRINASKLILKDSKGNVLEGRYELTIQKKTNSPIWYWYYKTSDYFPRVRILYDVKKNNDFYEVHVLKSINARILSLYFSNIFESSPLEISTGAVVKLRSIYAWDKLIRYTVYSFLKEAGVSEEKATHIRDIPVYYGTGKAHYTSLWWDQIKVESDGETFYTFSSDGSLRGDIEGLFHEYGHAVRENLWIDPSRYFRWRKLGGAHESVSAPCSSEYVAFDEGHSDMFASMLLQYARSKMQKLYDIPLPKPEMYTSQEFKGKKYRGELVEGRIAGFILNLLGNSPSAYKVFLQVVQKTKTYTFMKYMGHFYARPPRTITEWISIAYKELPNKRSKILQLCEEYNIRHFFDPGKSTGKMIGKYVLIYVNHYLTGGEAIFKRGGKTFKIGHDTIFGVLIRGEGILVGKKIYGKILFDGATIYFDSESFGTIGLAFDKDVVEIHDASVRIVSSKPVPWLKTKYGRYMVFNFKSDVIVRAFGENITIAVVKGSVYVSTPTKTIRLLAGNLLEAVENNYRIKKFSNINYKIGEDIKLDISTSSKQIVFGDTLILKISTNIKKGNLIVLAYNIDQDKGFILYNSTIKEKNIIVSKKYLPAGNYTVIAILPVNSFIGYESKSLVIRIAKSTPLIFIDVNKKEVNVGEEILVKGNITRYIGYIYLNITKPSGEKITKKIKLDGNSFEYNLKISEKGEWNIVAYTIETANSYASRSKKISIEAKESFNMTYVTVIVVIVVVVVALFYMRTRKRRRPQYTYPYQHPYYYPPYNG